MNEKRLLAFLLCFVVVAPMAKRLAAQAQASIQARFEVATVKPNVDKVLTMSGMMPSPGGRVSAKAATLKGMIQTAYKIQAREIIGGPDWADEDRYDVEAKAGTDVPWEPQLRMMFQTLLADRFQLKVHTESKEMPVYALTIGKNGPKLKKADTQNCPTESSGSCGGFATMIGRIKGQQGTMAQFAESLSRIMDRPVADKTGLTEFFALTLEWVPDETQYGDWGDGTYKRLVSDPSGPSVFTAVQDLGLRLERDRAPVEILVIDHAAKPQEN